MNRLAFKKIRKDLSGIISIIFLFMIFMFATDSYAQDVAATEVLAEDTSYQEEAPPPARLGLMPGINIPVVYLGSVLGMAFGADLYGDYTLPWKVTDGTYFRGALNVGFYKFSTTNDLSASITTIPVLFSGRLIYSYLLDTGFSPYVGLGGGFTSNLASGDISGSSMSPSAAINFGAEYYSPVFASLDFFIDFRYMMSFESKTGMFLTANIGMAYNFDPAWWFAEEETAEGTTEGEAPAEEAAPAE
jgi:hypothetical protein